MSRTFRAILFDLDETLIDEAHNIKAGYRAAAAYAADCFDLDPDVFADSAPAAVQAAWWEPDWLGPITGRYGLSAWDGLSEEFRGPHRDLDQLRDWLPQYRRLAWSNVFAQFGITPPRHILDETSRAFSWGRHKGRVRLARGVDALLPALHDRDLGIITNGPADGQDHKIHRAGLGRTVKAVVASTMAGIGKPDPSLVGTCLHAMGHDPGSDAVIIGDSLERDIQMAVNASRPAIWITSSGQPPPPGVIAVDSAAQVLAALQTLEDR